MTHELIFDYHPDQVFWCTADIGWVTGHSYIVYGPLANGGDVSYIYIYIYISYVLRVSQLSELGPLLGRYVEKHKVNIFYTAPPPSASLARSRR